LKTLIAAAVLAAAPAAPALADHGGPTVTVELGIQTVDERWDRDNDRDGDYRYRDRDRDRDWDRGWDNDRGVSRREAVRIAYSYGVTRVYDVDRRGGVWQVTGTGWRGGRIEIEISARSGRVLDIDYGRRGRW
jgi:hypothetical protein